MRVTTNNTGPGSIAIYSPASFALDLADIDAAITAGTASRILAARREVDVMLGSALLNPDMRDVLQLRVPRLKQAARSVSIT